MCFGVLYIYLMQYSNLMHLLTTFDFRETDLEIDYVRRHIAWRLRRVQIFKSLLEMFK